MIQESTNFSAAGCLLYLSPFMTFWILRWTFSLEPRCTPQACWDKFLIVNVFRWVTSTTIVWSQFIASQGHWHLSDHPDNFEDLKSQQNHLSPIAWRKPTEKIQSLSSTPFHLTQQKLFLQLKIAYWSSSSVLRPEEHWKIVFLFSSSLVFCKSSRKKERQPEKLVHEEPLRS